MSSYQQVTVKDRALVLMGQSPPSSACSESGDGLPFIQGNAEFCLRYPVPRLRCSAPTRIAEAGDILLSVRAPVGELNQATTRTVIGRGLSALRFPADDQAFAWHALKWSTAGLNKLAQGSTFVAVSRQDVENLEIPWLGDANKRIAAVLDTVDEGIAKTEAVIAKLKQVRTGLLHDLLTRGLDENGQLRDPVAYPEQFKDSPPGSIPREWRVSTLEQLELQIIDGDRGSNYPNESQLLEQGFCVFLNNKNIVNGGIDFSETQFISEERDSLLGKGKLNLDDIVITTRGTVGNIAWFSDLHPYRHVRINSGMIILRAYEEIFVPQFLMAVWRFLFPSEYRRLSSGSAQPQFPIRDMQQFRLLVPKKGEQERIVGVSTAVDGEIVDESRALAKLRQLKSGLVTDLLTGRVRVPELIRV